MKKKLCGVLALVMLLSLCACGQTPAAKPAETAAPVEEAAEWIREGYFMDEKENMLSVTWMDDVADPGWYVGVMLGEDLIEDSYGGTLLQEGSALQGSLTSSGSKPAITVTLTEEGDKGLQLTLEGGETYHFVEMELPDATIFVSINTEGSGNIDQTEGEEPPEIDPEHPFQSAQINLGEPATYTFVAWPNEGNVFVKWTKNGEDFSTEPQVTVLLEESADYVAVFEADGTAGDAIGMANPWREVSEDEAKELCIKSFSVPEGAENAAWSVMEAAADPSGVPGALVQLSFELDGLDFTAREQVTGDETPDISGMYYDWTIQEEGSLANWADGAITAQLSRFVGENEYADLCSWYDVEAGVSYTLAVTAKDLDGFDIFAVADALAG